MSKSKFRQYMESLDNEESKSFIENVKNLYLNENLTKKDIAKKLGVDPLVIRGLIEKYNISKSKDQIYRSMTDKRNETFKKRFGGNPFQNKEIKEKIKRTNLEKYGTECPRQHNEESKRKAEQTNLERYGSKNPFGSDEIKERIFKRITSGIPEEVQNIIYDKDKFSQFLSEFTDEERTWYNIYKRLKFNKTVVEHQYKRFELEHKYPIYLHNFKSHYEDDIIEFIKSIDNKIVIKKNCRYVCSPFEIDIYIPEFNFGIEFNGDYWHSELNKDSMYHQNKSFMFKEKNVFLYNVFEYEWNDPRKQEIIKSQIRNLLHKNERIIYARKCEIKEISPNDSRNFLNENHLQGNTNSKYKLGLFYNEELVSVMTFGSNRFGNERCLELHRFCNLMNTSIIGGGSKLFKYFLRNYSDKFESIISYCDISKGTGKLYENLGFKLEKVTSPNYVWISLETNEIKSRYQTQMKNEKEIMRSKGFIKIFDCGSYKFRLK